MIPSYNTGPKLPETVAGALRHWPCVWVVIDGSTDGSDEALARNVGAGGVRVLRRPGNGGKGAAVLDGLREAAVQGFTHVLVMDADGQHPAPLIPDFMALSRRHPGAMILGRPVFDNTAPFIRVIARRLSNVLARLETGADIGDSLFGFRVYPLAPLLEVMNETRRMRRFDFDAQAVVRLSWRGISVINQPAPVRYFTPREGGVSHFRYGRDNVLLAATHLRLLFVRPAGQDRRGVMPAEAGIHDFSELPTGLPVQSHRQVVDAGRRRHDVEKEYRSLKRPETLAQIYKNFLRRFFSKKRLLS